MQKCNMERHVTLHFTKKSQFPCEYCGKCFDSVTNVKDHITYNHLQERRFMCEICDKSFKKKSELIRHHGSHSDERPHVCTICRKTYKRLNHLSRHEKSAHQIVNGNRRIKKVDKEPDDELKVSPVLDLSKTDKNDDEISSENGSIVNYVNEISGTSNIVEQLVSLLPEKGWEITNVDFEEDLYNVYNDVNLSYGGEDQIIENIQESDILSNTQYSNSGSFM